MGACIFKCGSQNCYIEVADSGIGIPAEAQEQYPRDSTGWTKPIEEKLAEQDLVWHRKEAVVVMRRGAIKVFSQPSEGTTFTVRFC